jgi:hypothetical protein
MLTSATSCVFVEVPALCDMVVIDNEEVLESIAGTCHFQLNIDWVDLSLPASELQHDQEYDMPYPYHVDFNAEQWEKVGRRERTK